MLEEPVKITLDKERTLRLPLKGMLEYQRLTGINLLEGFKLDPKSLEQWAALTYSCLLHEDKELTYDDVTLLLDIDNIAETIDAVGKCLKMSMAAYKEKRGKSPLPKKPRVG